MSYIQVLQKVDFQLKDFQLVEALHRQWVTTNHDNTQFTFRKVNQLDLLHCHSLPSVPVQRAIDRSKCSLPQTVAQLLFDRIHRSAFVPTLRERVWSVHNPSAPRHPLRTTWALYPPDFCHLSSMGSSRPGSIAVSSAYRASWRG